MDADALIERLRALSNPANVTGMARYGINPRNTLGVSMPALRGMARELGRNHALAEQLWATDVHEARILASLVADARQVDEAQMERWVADLDSWDVCDQCCSNLWSRAAPAYRKALEWSERDEEFVKRAGFVLMATLAVHDKKADDAAFESFLPLIAREADDERNFVKKAVNWALRQIGKRNAHLNAAAVATAQALQGRTSRAARWVANDALRELSSEQVQRKLRR